MKTTNNRRGVTVIEMILVVAIIGIIYMLAHGAFYLINQFLRQQYLVQIQQEAEILLYNISTEVRRSQKFVTISQDTLSFTSYDYSKGHDTGVNSSLFLATNLVTTTYQVKVNGPSASLIKTVQDSGGTTLYQKEFLKDLLVPATALLYFSIPVPSNASTTDANTVLIVLRLSPPKWGIAPLDYSVQSMRRT